MARRSILQTLRQPAMVIPPILFPLILMAINVGGLDAATKIPGFPTDNYLDFAIAVPFIQGALFASINAGTRARARRRDRVPEAPRADADAARRAAARAASPACMVVALSSGLIYLASASPPGCTSRPASAACWCCSCWRC